MWAGTAISIAASFVYLNCYVKQLKSPGTGRKELDWTDGLGYFEYEKMIIDNSHLKQKKRNAASLIMSGEII